MANKIGKAKGARWKPNTTNRHRRAIPEIVDAIIRQADIILEVLDARFIDKTRNPDAEGKIRKLGKVAVYVLNKSDLANTNKIQNEVELHGLKPCVFFSSKTGKGLRNLRNIIKIEAKKLNKDTVNIGVIGYPNTGKSSLVNLFAGSSKAGTSSVSGFTKGIKKIKISEGLYLIDTPGVIPVSEMNNAREKNYAKHSQIGAIDWNKAKNPELTIHRIMQEYPNMLEKHYGVDCNGDSEMLIESLGKKWNYLKKGGETDEVRTAKKILRDWQEGKVRS